MTGSLKRGWCPGALRPMQSGDGLILRVRPRAGALSLDAMLDIAHGALQYGNGILDLTRRANLQVRGLCEKNLPGMHDILHAHDLLDETQAAEQVRNIMLSPLTSIDPAELLDIRPIAQALEARLTHDERLWRLPGKFGFILESGASPGLENERADIRLVAIQNEKGRIGFKVGLDRPETIKWVGETFENDREHLIDILANIALAVISQAPKDTKQVPRMRNLSFEKFSLVEKSARSEFNVIAQPDMRQAPPSSQESSRSEISSSCPLGLIEFENDHPILALALPFGSQTAQNWISLVEAAKSAGIVELRLSPWRTVYLPLPSKNCAPPLLEAATQASFVSDHNNPLLKIDACPGAPACTSAMSDTRKDARAIAAQMRFTETIKSIHVSGCEKGCARSKPAHMVLVAKSNGYALARNATVSQAPETLVPYDRVSRIIEEIEPLLGPSQNSSSTRKTIRA